MNRTVSLALAALLLTSLPAPASAVPLERISADEQPIDIVSAALRGSEGDINTVLARSAKIFVMKTWNGTTVDARDVAVYYALFCGRPEAARLSLKRGFGRDFDELAEVHDGDALADVTHHREVMRDEEVREAELFLQARKQVDDLRLDRDIECRNRLVADDDLRIDGEGARDADALALSARELVREAVRLLWVQADEV